MQNNKINQENEEPKSLLKRLINWLDRKEPGIAFMWGLLLAELGGFGLYIMLLTCSTKTIIIISVSAVLGLVMLLGLEKLIMKIFFRKKSQAIKSASLDGNQNPKESLIDKNKEDENKIEDLNSNVKTEDTHNINNI